MKKPNGQDNPCQARPVRINSNQTLSHPNLKIRLALPSGPAHDEVKKHHPIATFGDTLVPTDTPLGSLESRRRRAGAELERRIHAGEDCSAKEHFAADPELEADKEAALDLIYSEFCARREVEHQLPLEEYYQQYPQWRQELKRLFDIDQGMLDPPPARLIRILGPDGAAEEYHVLKDVSQSPNGTVVKAQHVNRNGSVAVKTFRGSHPADRERFRAGARAQKRLRHANILPVHELAESEDGDPCFSMEFAEGGSLDQQIAGQPQVAEYAARLVRTLAEAVSYAHHEGIVHRDLKPANVVLSADGVPKITDFGLARRQDTPRGQSQNGEILGTPPYMPPEQAAGQTQEVGPLSDVYALGAILYEMLTGQPPFQALTVVETLKQVLHQPPRRLRRSVPRGLESICLKCLEKKPRRRYGSAQALTDDLGRWLDGKRPQADGSAGRASRFMRRHPGPCSAAGFLLLLVLSTPLTAYYLDPERLPKNAFAALERSEKVQLIDDTGRGWMRILAGAPTIETHPEEGACRISALRTAYVELLPRSRKAGYRLQAKLRHEDSQPTGEVGLYFLHERFETTRGAEHCLCVLKFNDRVLAATPPKGKEPENWVGLDLIRYRKQDKYCSNTPTGVSDSFKPAVVTDRSYRPWRDLEVIVAEDGMAVFWESRRPGQSVPSQQLAAIFWDRLNSPNDRQEFEPALIPSFSPAGGLGLYVDNGSVSIKDLSIGPYDGPLPR